MTREERNRRNRERRAADPEKYRKYSREYIAKWRQKNPEKAAAIEDRRKKTAKRKEWRKDWNETNRDKCLQYRKTAYRRWLKKIGGLSALPPERLAKLGAWSKANPDKALAVGRRWYDRNREKAIAKTLAWMQANPEKAKKNAAQSGRAHRARKAGASGAHTFHQWTSLLKSYHRQCVYCGKPATTRDHLIPLVKGGTNDIGNIVPACHRCNASKNDTTLLVWMTRRASRRTA